MSGSCATRRKTRWDLRLSARKYSETQNRCVPGGDRTEAKHANNRSPMATRRYRREDVGQSIQASGNIASTSQLVVFSCRSKTKATTKTIKPKPIAIQKYHDHLLFSCNFPFATSMIACSPRPARQAVRTVKTAR